MSPESTSRVDLHCNGITWERSLQRLADGYRRALEPADAMRDVSRAA